MLNEKRLTLPMLLLMTVVLYLLLHTLFGGTLFASSPYNSYTLQAMAWRNGQLGLGQDYPWLELAIYGGDYYVSFPPVPTLIMLPFTFFFETETPDNAIILGFLLATLATVYLTARKIGASELAAAFFSTFFGLGSNLLWLCSDGAVWFLAQALNAVFCTLAICFAVHDRRVLSLGCAALAVGCRPFSILLFFPLLFLFVEQDRDRTELPLRTAVIAQWKVLILPALIGIAYMCFNYARFHHPLEFGHSYLPEFNRGEPQFHYRYILPNLKNILRPITLTKTGAVQYPFYEGFLFVLANPFFLLLLSRLRKVKPYQWAACICMVLNLLLLLMHRTFGGWQFGARYTVDLLPYVLLSILPMLKHPPKYWELWLGGFAILLNLYGAIAMHILHA